MNEFKKRHSDGQAFVTTGKKDLAGQQFSAYDTKARESTIIVNPQLTTLKNGVPAIKGMSEKTPGLKVHRIISRKEAEKLKNK